MTLVRRNQMLVTVVERR
jgi:hypothetical protein